MTRREALAALIGLAAALGGPSLQAQEPARYYVVGHVKTPGSYTYQDNLTVQQAIAMAGGLTDRGSARRLKIRRKVDGQDVEVDARMSSAVLPNDTIVVAQRLLD